MDTIAGFVHEALQSASDAEKLASVGARVKEFARSFPLRTGPGKISF
jgi:hypothetical protein